MKVIYASMMSRIRQAITVANGNHMKIDRIIVNRIEFIKLREETMAAPGCGGGFNTVYRPGVELGFLFGVPICTEGEPCATP